MTEAEALQSYDEWTAGGVLSQMQVNILLETLVPVLRAVREENASLRKVLGEAQHLLASRHFPRPLI